MRLVLVRVHLQARPSPFLTERSPGAQELLVRIADAARVAADDDARPRALHEVRVLVVDEDEPGAAVREYVVDLGLREADVDRREDRAGADHALEGICERGEPSKRSGERRRRDLLSWASVGFRTERRGGGERGHARVGGYDGYAVAGLDAGVDKAIGEVLDALRPVACVNVRAGAEHDEAQPTHQTA